MRALEVKSAAFIAELKPENIITIVFTVQRKGPTNRSLFSSP